LWRGKGKDRKCWARQGWPGKKKRKREGGGGKREYGACPLSVVLKRRNISPQGEVSLPTINLLNTVVARKEGAKSGTSANREGEKGKKKGGGGGEVEVSSLGAFSRNRQEMRGTLTKQGNAHKPFSLNRRVMKKSSQKIEPILTRVTWVLRTSSWGEVGSQ